MRRTVEIAPNGPRPSISLRRVPPCEPPFDDEIEPAVWASAHQIALDWSPAALRRAAEPPARVFGGAAVAVSAQRSVVAGASHDAKLAVHRFVRLCVEVLNGHRPPAHLRHVSVPADAGAVVTQALVGARRVAELRRAAQHPGRRQPRRPSPVAVIRLRLCEPRPGAVEAAVALVTGERTWAMALRMELHQQAWCATILRLI
ncbi:Rv3235 family protein [Paractinoplanes globisporus]|uniref:Rv3235 family protein n=1 Tax=Paractinoplanes globisporus TaxID=113565 RepID=A0ABW6WDI5_9ACTN|nr:Rv3235 family protein [Actinoplanes globisporus]